MAAYVKSLPPVEGPKHPYGGRAQIRCSGTDATASAANVPRVPKQTAAVGPAMRGRSGARGACAAGPAAPTFASDRDMINSPSHR